MYQMEMMFDKVKDATGVAESHVSALGLHWSGAGSSSLKGVFSCPAPALVELSTSVLTSFHSLTVLTSLVCLFWEFYLSGSVSKIITVWNDLGYSRLPNIVPNHGIPALRYALTLVRSHAVFQDPVYLPPVLDPALEHTHPVQLVSPVWFLCTQLLLQRGYP